MLKEIVLLSLCSATIYAKFKPRERFEDGYFYVPENRSDVVSAAATAFNGLSMTPIKRTKAKHYRMNLRRVLLAEAKNTTGGEQYRILLVVDFTECVGRNKCTGLEKSETDIYTVVVKSAYGQYQLISYEIPILHTLIFNPKGCNNTSGP